MLEASARISSLNQPILYTSPSRFLTCMNPTAIAGTIETVTMNLVRDDGPHGGDVLEDSLSQLFVAA